MSKKFIIIFVTFLAILLIILGFFLIGRKKNVESFTNSSDQYSPNSNLIRHGSFDNQLHISNSQVGPGNDIINYPNPGESSYVLRQSTQISNCDDDNVTYRIRLNLNKTKTYKLSCWVCLSDDWNGSNYLFNLRIFNSYNSTLKKSEGTQIDSKKMYNILWTQFEYILQLNYDDTGEVNWLLGFQPNNTEGYRYITGVSVTLFNPLLTDFKLTYGLQLFTNTFEDSSYNSSNLIWKDLSNNGRDLSWSQLTTIKNDGGVNINNLDVQGPKLCQLGIRPSNNFTIMWMAKYHKVNKCQTGENIFEIFSLYTQNDNLPYIRISIDLFRQNFIITIGHITYPGISLGLCNSQSVYSLIKAGNRFFIRKDDVQLNSSELFIYHGSEKTQFSSQQNLIFNPQKNLNSEIYACLIYNYSLNCYEIESVRTYLMSIKKSNNYNYKVSCCPTENKYPDKQVDSEFDISDEMEIHPPNHEHNSYESTAYQQNYYNNILNIPQQFVKETFTSKRPKMETVTHQPEIEHFTSSKRSSEEQNGLSEENDNKYSNLRRMLMEQNILSEEETKKPLRPPMSKKSSITNIPPGLPPMPEESLMSDEYPMPEESLMPDEYPITDKPPPYPNSSKSNNPQSSDGRQFPEQPEEEYVVPPEEENYVLPSQEFKDTTSSVLYQDESSKSNKRILAEETEEEIQKTSQPNRRESLKLKLKLLKEMIAEEEEEMVRNPLSKVKKLIDTQGETVEEANYETFSQDACFNRVPQKEEDTKCQVDPNVYIKKSDVENKYISKTELNQDYIKKDSIPCWGCNLK